MRALNRAGFSHVALVALLSGCPALPPATVSNPTPLPIRPTDAAVGGGAPRFDQVLKLQTTIAASGDSADVYYPNKDRTLNGGEPPPFPVAVFLQGANVDRVQYQNFAVTLASYGFLVVVPNHLSLFGFFPELNEIDPILAFLERQTLDVDSVLFGLPDTRRLFVLGHSFGGAAALDLVRDVCAFPFCRGHYRRPAQLLGVVTYGADLANPFTGAPPPPIGNDGIPVGMIRGTDDGLAGRGDAERTFDQIQDPPKSLVTLQGANHYGITNANNPLGARHDPNPPVLDQAVATESAGRWSAVFLRAYGLGDAQALEYMTTAGPETDPHAVIVLEQE